MFLVHRSWSIGNILLSEYFAKKSFSSTSISAESETISPAGFFAASKLSKLTPLSTRGATDGAPTGQLAEASAVCPDQTAKLDQILAALSQQTVLAIQCEVATSKAAWQFGSRAWGGEELGSISESHRCQESSDHSFFYWPAWPCSHPPPPVGWFVLSILWRPATRDRFPLPLRHEPPFMSQGHIWPGRSL